MSLRPLRVLTDRRSMVLSRWREPATRLAATGGPAAALASRPSRLLFFFGHPLRIAPAGIFLRCAFRILFEPVSRCCSGRVAEVATAAQLSVEDAAPVRLGHLWPLARHLRQPGPCARRALFHLWPAAAVLVANVVQICCCSSCGRRKPRVACAVTQSRPVPSGSRYERSVDGPLASGGAGIG